MPRDRLRQHNRIKATQSVGLLSRLTVLSEILGADIKRAGRKRLVDGDAADPGPIHPDMSDQVPTSVHHRDVYRLADLLGLLSGSGDQHASKGEIQHA